LGEHGDARVEAEEALKNIEGLQDTLAVHVE
jgi:hypothetical protein